jgi:outer membrane murein-binding lipoprotein Lpp
MRRRASFHIAASAAGIALLIGGCSAHRKPVAAVAKAELAVKQADESAAPRYAELDLKLAREKLAKAKERLEDDDHKEARWLADEALVDAQLAEVKAESAEARAAAVETRSSIEVIRNEANRGFTVEHRETVKTIEVH